MLELRDAHARVARDLRVSLTDRCNLRCVYCMPAEGMQWIPRDETLTDDEAVRLIRVGVERLGITKVRFTGGEPLIRPGLTSIVARVKQLRLPDGSAPETALTTNGIGLAPRAEELRDAGLDRVNISIDSLDKTRYAQMSRRDRLSDVLEAIAASRAAGLRPVKINAVIMRGINESDVVPLAEFALKGGYELRFIEQMPLGPKGEWDRHDMVTAQELLDTLGARFQLTPATEPRGAAPAELWSVAPRRHPAGRAHRRHRIGFASVLRQLRPHQDYQRRPNPHLSVLAHRDGPALAASFGGRRRYAGGGLGGRTSSKTAGPRH